MTKEEALIKVEEMRNTLEAMSTEIRTYLERWNRCSCYCHKVAR